MEDFQLRVINEQKELSEKILKLTEFTDGNIFSTLPEDEQTRLGVQLVFMNAYNKILQERIVAFS